MLVRVQKADFVILVDVTQQKHCLGSVECIWVIRNFPLMLLQQLMLQFVSCIAKQVQPARMFAKTSLCSANRFAAFLQRLLAWLSTNLWALTQNLWTVAQALTNTDFILFFKILPVYIYIYKDITCCRVYRLALYRIENHNISFLTLLKNKNKIKENNKVLASAFNCMYFHWNQSSDALKITISVAVYNIAFSLPFHFEM